MNRLQLEHIIRASAGNADTTDIVIVGSQAILGTYPDAPREMLISMEADVFPRDDSSSAILIDGAIGENSIFHETFGYYAHGIGEDTAVLPEGWKDRLVPITNENTRGATGWCVEVYDLIASKLVAGRPKDIDFVEAAFRHHLVEERVLQERILTLPIDANRAQALKARLQRLLNNLSR